MGIWFSTFRDKELALKCWEPNKKNIPKEMIHQTPITWVISGFPHDIYKIGALLEYYAA
jgi:hypothetical protein